MSTPPPSSNPGGNKPVLTLIPPSCSCSPFLHTTPADTAALPSKTGMKNIRKRPRNRPRSAQPSQDQGGTFGENGGSPHDTAISEPSVSR